MVTERLLRVASSHRLFAFTSLTDNILIGAEGSTKEYAFLKHADGSVRVTASVRTDFEVFPGTDIPYDGTPGIEPVVASSRIHRSESTIQAEQAEALFGELIDVSKMPTEKKE